MAEKRPIGWVSPVVHYCIGCAPDGLTENYPPLREGDDYGVPYSCDVCGANLKPQADGGDE